MPLASKEGIPPITSMDVPFDYSYHTWRQDAFSDIFQFLNSIGIRQLMTNGKCLFCGPYLWKLCGCMYNAFGICHPTTNASATDLYYTVETRPALLLSPFQIYHVTTYKHQVLVFAATTHERKIYFEEVYCAICRFAIKSSFPILTFPPFEIIADYVNFPKTTLECFIYDPMQSVQKRTL